MDSSLARTAITTMERGRMISNMALGLRIGSRIENGTWDTKSVAGSTDKDFISGRMGLNTMGNGCIICLKGEVCTNIMMEECTMENGNKTKNMETASTPGLMAVLMKGNSLTTKGRVLES